MIESDFFITPADYHSDLNALRTVRETVFVLEQQVPIEEEWDALDPLSSHVLARDNAHRPIGTARLTPERKIGRMAVVAEWRGRGVGDALLQNLIDIARSRGWPEVSLNAQVDAIGFYQRAGFVAYGEPFIEAGIHHQAMRKALDPMTRFASSSTPRPTSTPASAVDSLAQAIEITCAIINGARSELGIYSRDLDHELLAHSEVLAALRRFATSYPHAEVRLIVHDPIEVVQAGHPLLTLAQRLPSRFAFRSPSDPVDRQYAGAYLYSDQGGFYHRPLGSRYEGEASACAPARARQLGNTFAPVWERSRLCNEFRVLAI